MNEHEIVYWAAPITAVAFRENKETSEVSQSSRIHTEVHH